MEQTKITEKDETKMKTKSKSNKKQQKEWNKGIDFTKKDKMNKK